MSRNRMIGRATVGVAAGILGALSAIKAKDASFVASIWETLEQSPTAGGVFHEDMVADLPEPARRYFLHAIQPGTPRAAHLHWCYSAQMKPGDKLPWMSLTAEQILVKDRGFVWKAQARKGPLFLTVDDHYLDGVGRTRVNLFGLIPVVNASGPDISRSAMGRLVIEGIALPSAFLPSPHVQIEGLNESRFTVTVDLHGETTTITVTVDPEGRPQELVLPRWGNLTDDGSFRYIPYGVILDNEQTVGGYTIPTGVRGGWWYGTDQYLEVIRLNVEWARLY